jgi:hypothetical protein
MSAKALLDIEEPPATIGGIEKAIHASRRCPISKARGRPLPQENGPEIWVTAHPLYLLRLKDEMKEQQERLFRADPAAVAERLAELAELAE